MTSVAPSSPSQRRREIAATSLALGATALLSSGMAPAQERPRALASSSSRKVRHVYGIDLGASLGERPNFVCVVTRYREGPTSFRLSDVISEEDRVRGVYLLAPSAPRRLSPGQADSAENLQSGQAAFEAMSSGAESRRRLPCGGTSGACRPGFAIPRARTGYLDVRGTPGVSDPLQEAYSIFCGRSTNAVPDRDSVLILYYDDLNQGLRSQVEAVAVSGRRVTLTASVFRSGEPHAPTVTVLGGDYIAGHSTELRADQASSIPLQNWCVRRNLHVGPMLAPTAGVAMPDRHLAVRVCAQRREGDTGIACEMPVAETVAVMVPRGLPSVQQEVVVGVVAGPPRGAVDESVSCSPGARPAAPNPGESWFASRWMSDEPPETPVLEARTFEFAWRPPCEFPYRDSDHELDVVAAEQRVRCEPIPRGDRRPHEESDVLRFRCGAGADALVHFPVDVAVRAGPGRELYTLRVHRPGETIEYDGGAAERRLVVDFQDWALSPEDAAGCHGSPCQGSLRHESFLQSRLNTSGDWISSVEVYTGENRSFSFRPDRDFQRPRHRLPGAGLACGDRLRYRIYGARTYDTGLVEVVNGRLRIPPPETTAHALSLVLTVGGGLSTRLTDSLRDNPAGFARVGIRWHPLWTFRRHINLPFALEFDVGYQFDMVPARADMAANWSLFPYSRILVGGGIEFALWRSPVAVGGHWWAAFGFPFFYDDRDRARAENFFIQQFHTRVSLSRNIGLEASLWWYRTNRYTGDSSDLVWTLQPSLALRVNIGL